MPIDSFGVRQPMKVSGKQYDIFSLKKLEERFPAVRNLPYSIKVLLENLLRHEDGRTIQKESIEKLANWHQTCSSHEKTEISFYPSRVLMQDFTGVPAIVDLAAMRDATKILGGNPSNINPKIPVDLVIDHSIMVDYFGSFDAREKNERAEVERNQERYAFLKWGQSAFKNFSVVPPGTGICHQVNLEYLSKVVASTPEEDTLLFPDTLVGTDSHTTMVNALSVLGWGVGGIEAEAAMLGEPLSMLIPEVVGFKLDGKLSEGITATDLVLTVTNLLRSEGVVGKFVEFFGQGLSELTLADRATISNMAPEYGATCGFFPIDTETLRYLKLTGKEDEKIAIIKEYAVTQGLWREDKPEVHPAYTKTLELDLSTVQPCVSGPKRPQDKIFLNEVPLVSKKDISEALPKEKVEHYDVYVEGSGMTLRHGDIVIAAITSCTNTSNPSVMLAAGLVARKAQEKGLSIKPWVKTSLAPGSKVVSEYLEKTGLQNDLDKLGFNLVGYGCTTCIGNSGPLTPAIEKAIKEGELIVASVLSGNRNFEGRINPSVKQNFLASPPLVVAYAIAGTMHINLLEDILGYDHEGHPVFLKDIWPTNAEIQSLVKSVIHSGMFKEKYQDVFKGDDSWKNLNVPSSETYSWNNESTYIKNPPYFEGMFPIATMPSDIIDAKALAILGDSVTTDHISPAGAIPEESPAGKYLKDKDIPVFQFNSFGARRGNDEVMVRGTFGNIRIQNELVPEKRGGYTRISPQDQVMSIYEAAKHYEKSKTPLVVIAGQEYGTGSSRDWAAKGTLLLGVKAVIAESFERIHRSNLIGMGVLPLTFMERMNRKTLSLDGSETFTIKEISKISPLGTVTCVITRNNGDTLDVPLRVCIDTENELISYQNGGILKKVLRKMSLS